MQLTSFTHKVSENFVTAVFKGNIFKILATNSLELSFERLGGKYIPEQSGKHGSIWQFPTYINSEIISEIIKNTCFECGGLMKDAHALQNTLVSFDDFGNDAGSRGTTQSRIGSAIFKNVRKCTQCGHSHT